MNLLSIVTELYLNLSTQKTHVFDVLEMFCQKCNYVWRDFCKKISLNKCALTKIMRRAKHKPNFATVKLKLKLKFRFCLF